jgi:hypothetical protein
MRRWILLAAALDHTTYDTTSILRFIEWRHNLPPLGTRDARAANLISVLDLGGGK